MSSAVMSLSIWCGNGVRKVKKPILLVEKIPFDMVAAFELKMERLGATDKPCGEGVRMLTQNCC